VIINIDLAALVDAPAERCVIGGLLHAPDMAFSEYSKSGFNPSMFTDSTCENVYRLLSDRWCRSQPVKMADVCHDAVRHGLPGGVKGAAIWLAECRTSDWFPWPMVGRSGTLWTDDLDRLPYRVCVATVAARVVKDFYERREAALAAARAIDEAVNGPKKRPTDNRRV
jgi:hypothetical protein